MNGLEENQTFIQGLAMGISEPIGYMSQCDLLMLRGNWPGQKNDSNSGYKRKDAWRLAQAVILFLATYLMSSGPILVFF
jgi:hypothetical protein